MKTEFLNLIGEDGEESFELFVAENHMDVSYLILTYAKEIGVAPILDAMNFQFNITKSKWNIVGTPINVVFDSSDDSSTNQWDIKINNKSVYPIYPPQAYWVIENVIYYSYKEACKACKMPYYKIIIHPDFSYREQKDYKWKIDPKYADWILT